MSNTLGEALRLTTFGESHGPAIGGILDGIPAGFRIDYGKLQERMYERRPGNNPLVSPRKETDRLELLSGIYMGVTLGTPIGFIIRNEDCKSTHYDELRDHYRPGHADYSYMRKYGIRDHRGGGRASARTTASLVAAGAIASQIIESEGVKVETWVKSAGKSDSMESEIESCLRKGDSCGGLVKGKITGIPAGLGEPLFGKFQAKLASAIFSINAVKGFEYGRGFRSASEYGSECLDRFVNKNGSLVSERNINGGIAGGITTGETITFSVAFKPTPTSRIASEIFNGNGEKKNLTISGRHDPCVAVRGSFVVRAVTELVILDSILLQKMQRSE